MSSLRSTTLAVLGTAGLVAASTMLAAPALAASRSHTPRVRAAIVTGHRRVPANGTATTRVRLRLFGPHEGGGQPVTLSTSATPSGGGSCGTLAKSTGTTGRHGVFATLYTASSSIGFCTITATSGALGASTTLVQVDATLAAAGTHDRLQAVATPTRIKADAMSTSTITLTVQDATSPVAGDPIWVSEVSLPRRATCGSVALGSPTTGANGQVTATYTASGTPGRCLLRVTEAATGRSSRVLVIHQTA